MAATLWSADGTVHRSVHEVPFVLSLEKCRKLLPTGVVVSDVELEIIREGMSVVADAVVDELDSKQGSVKDEESRKSLAEVREVKMDESDQAIEDGSDRE